MNLILVRDPSSTESTIGHLYQANGDGNMEFLCFTLEDVVREVDDQPVELWKKFGQTAIPRGRYAVDITLSQRFGIALPILLNVPGFTGVRIHAGNTATDTDGCILVGTNRGNNSIAFSRNALAVVMRRIQAAFDAQENVWITIK